MLVLLINIGLIFLYWTIISSSIKGKKRDAIFLVSCFFHIMFLYVFKDAGLFPDLDTYMLYYNGLDSSFNNIASERLHDRFGIGWYLLNKSVKYLGGDYNTLFFVIYAIMTLCYFIIISKYSSNTFFSILIFICSVFYSSIFVLRQSLAVAICLLSIPFVIKKKITPFVIITAIAISVHGSAWVWSIVYILNMLKISKIVIILFVIAFFVFYNAIDWGILFFTEYYSELLAYESEGEGGTYKVVLMHAAIILFAFLTYKGGKRMSEVNKLFVLMLFCALFMDISAMIGSHFGQFSRLSNYFSVASLFLVPTALEDLSAKKDVKIILHIVIAIAYVFLMNSIVQYGFNLDI